jgi:hypothetical protein
MAKKKAAPKAVPVQGVVKVFNKTAPIEKSAIKVGTVLECPADITGMKQNVYAHKGESIKIKSMMGSMFICYPVNYPEKTFSFNADRFDQLTEVLPPPPPPPPKG